MPKQRRFKLVAAILVACGALASAPAAPVLGKTPSRQPAWGGPDSPLRPGAAMGGCTLNFVFYTPGTRARAPKGYIGTAGHCTDKVGEEITPPGLEAIGKVVYDSDTVKSTVDFSLIELYPEMIGKTNPEVLHWGGPTRVANEEDFAFGDQVDVYGYGLAFGQTEQTRPRYGVLVGWTDEEYQADMPAVNGDSGAPLIHHATGAALGIISRYGFTVPPSTDLGPLMTWILEELERAGFNVKLATVRR
ncbi:MAG: S1 family peptidase [Actinomycetota bacterium]|nr:S1 family peptidase [Actinomycetota bacterium]